MKGQSSMATIVVAVILLVFLTVFLLTVSEPAGSEDVRTEYRGTFATNMLLSILNTETADCGSLSDMLKAEYLGGESGTCGSTEFGNRIGQYVDFLLLSSGHTDYAWLLEASPKDFEYSTMQWGDPTVKDKKGYWDARTFLTLRGNMLEVKLYMKTK